MHCLDGYSLEKTFCFRTQKNCQKILKNQSSNV